MRILLITPEFFGYERAIEKALVKLGWEVDWYPHIYAPNNLYKALYRFFSFVMKPHYYRYLLSHINYSRDYDKIVIIKGEGVGEKLLIKLKSLFPKAKLIFYNWDSFKNNSISSEELSIYDKVKSFDGEDCARNKSIEHLPLFYSNEFKLDENVEADYLFFFAGTLHSNRYLDVKKIACSIKGDNESYIYFYCQSKPIFYLKKAFGKLPKDLSISEVGFVKKCKTELRNSLLKSNCVIDFAHDLQVGLTMRTIEALGMKKKIVTNNSSVVDYDFYNENNIYVLGKSKCTLDEFLLRPYSDVPDEIYERYDIDNWVLRLID
ncbi:CgeB family protein [Shewanella sedimentimangrovi]|uniref:Eps11J n=1 Tax=Shewanella sedimentimangrovi TaxID=2814293 RepID=A0ABX7QYH9_9GAMM|nr:hypothetical protein [Shewanella sedimentimangrovi]QSX36040.1 hypothetical protein JYB85_11900 [Shewanella sedimentimangrovi]